MVNPVPEGLQSLTPQLIVDGAADAIEFYRRAFGAQEVMRAPDPSGKKIWHASIRIGGSTLFVNDAFPEMGAGASTARLWLYLEGVDAVFERAIAAGATVKAPLADMFWGDRVGTLMDRWGNQWILAQHVKDLLPAELQQAQDDAAAQWNQQKG